MINHDKILDKYKYIFLDTNALREIVTNNNLSGKIFLEKFIIEKYVPCFSIYNIWEIKPLQDIYDKFIDFFSIVPCLVIFPNKLVLAEEYKCYQRKEKMKICNKISNVFSPLGKENTYRTKLFFEGYYNNKQLKDLTNEHIAQLNTIASNWQDQRAVVGKISFVEYKKLEKDIVVKDLQNWGVIQEGVEIELDSFPAARIMEYSHFRRVHQTNKFIKPNDVLDIEISCIVPYVNAVITERFQCDVYRAAQKFIPQMNEVNIYTMSELR